MLSNIFSRVTFIDRLLFTKHLAVMLKSGIPISEAVAILKEQTRNPAFRKILIRIAAEIDNGQTLARALGHFPNHFDFLYRSIVEVGEESGNLDTNLDYLAKELSKGYEFKKKVQGALLYPSLVLLVMLGVGGGIAFFVLPQLVELFESLNTDLPASTKILLGVAKVSRDYGLVIAALLGGAVTLLTLAVRLPAVKPWWHRFLLKLPVFGPFFRDVAIATFCRNLGLMLSSGLTITAAFRASIESTPNLVFKNYVERLAKAVEKGKSLEAELTSGHYSYIPLIVPRMIGVGEKTGKLDESLLYLGEFFSEEVDDMTKNLPTILEPILLVIIALGVAFVAMSIVTPIYQFTASVKR